MCSSHRSAARGGCAWCGHRAQESACGRVGVVAAPDRQLPRTVDSGVERPRFGHRLCVCCGVALRDAGHADDWIAARRDERQYRHDLVPPSGGGSVRQTGVVTDVHFFDNASLTAFYPASTPLLHALGIELLGTDLLSPVLNFAFLAVTLLAVWCIGRPFGVAPVALVAVAAVVGTPMLATTQPGGGYNDIAGIAFFLSALALLTTARREPHGCGIAGMRVAAVAAGLALGTKYNFILPVAALSLGVFVLAAKGQRVRQALEWTALVLLAGGFFYARNLVVVGNPVPPVSIGIGPWSLPNPPSGVDEISPLSVLGQRSLWQSIFEPALRDAFGPLWWLVLALVGAGLLCAIVTRGDAFVRVLGMIATVSVLGYLVTPASIGTKRFPATFVYSLRYAAYAAVLAAVALTISSIGRRYARVVLLLFVAVLVATQFDPSIWPTDLRQRGSANRCAARSRLRPPCSVSSCS